MANVQPYVQQIRSAVYGEQVRESIARSIEEMNQDNIDTQAHYDSTITEVETATENANTAATSATNIKDEVQQKLDDGDFIGEQGPEGRAATITVGTVQTGNPGTAAQVTNSGTSADAVLNFTIPRGATGEIDNLDTATVTFPIDDTYQNIASGMTVTQLFSRIQLLLGKTIGTNDFYYGTCPTEAAGTTDKIVTVNSSFQLKTGTLLAVKFDNDAISALGYERKLNVNGTGAINISVNGMTTFTYCPWMAGEVGLFVYDGTYWQMLNPTEVPTDISSLFSVSASTGTITELIGTRQGNLVTLTLGVKRDASVREGYNIFNGNISSADLRPVTSASAVYLTGTSSVNGYVSSGGGIRCMVLGGDVAANTVCWFTFMYFVE